jgi:hypothetical protein
MRGQWMVVIVAASLLCSSVPAMEVNPREDVELETVLVIGEQPGPGLWKVTHGDHVMWILPSLNPLQSRLNWHTQEVEARLAASQEVLLPPEVEVNPSVGVMDVLRLLPAIPAALKVGKNPGGAKLQKVVPPAAHARWLELRQRYYVQLGKKSKEEDLEEWRPSVALMMLGGMVQIKNQLGNGRVNYFVMEAAKKNKVPVNRPPRILRVVKLEKNIRGMLKDAAAVPPAEITCFVEGLEKLEPDVALMKARANAWARGDIPKLKELHRQPELADACMFSTVTALTDGDSRNATAARKMLEAFMWHDQQGRVQAQRDWVSAAGKSLGKNASTFAVLPVADMFRAGGYLDSLQAAGYVVEEPR